MLNGLSASNVEQLDNQGDASSRDVPADALALEDSASGIAAAKAAGLTCIAVPQFAETDVSAADRVIDSLEVDWPVSRTHQVFHDVAVNRAIEIHELADAITVRDRRRVEF